MTEHCWTDTHGILTEEKHGRRGREAGGVAKAFPLHRVSPDMNGLTISTVFMISHIYRISRNFSESLPQKFGKTYS